MTPSDIHKFAGLFKALGEFNRLSLVYKLCECQTPQNTMCLCECCSVDASVVSRHLKVLAQEGVVTFEKQGREKIYSLNRAYLANQLRELADLIENEPSKESPWQLNLVNVIVQMTIVAKTIAVLAVL